MDEWNTKALKLQEGGLKYSSLCALSVFFKKQLILEFSFAIPGTSAAIERVFAITNALWTDRKNRFLIETIKAVIVTKMHFEELSCNDFYTLISNSPKLLQEICSFMKYKTSAQEERTAPSTLIGN
jgi:hypothetical protein